jgi:hypothetical protein
MNRHTGILLAATTAIAIAYTPSTLSQTVENQVYASLSRIRLQTITEDRVDSGPMAWNRFWFSNMINRPDGAGPVINPVIDVQTTLPLFGFWPSDPSIFTADPSQGRYVWTYTEPLDEAVSAQGWAHDTPDMEVSDIQYTGVRTVQPQLLTTESTLQTVTFTWTLDQPLPSDATSFGIFIGTPKIASGGFSLVEGRLVSQSPVPGWTQYTDGITASWFARPSALPVGDTYVFQATLQSTKSPALIGSPVFKPEVFTVLSRNSPPPRGTPTSIVIQHPTEAISVMFRADNPVTWTPSLTEWSYDFHLNPRVSAVTPPPHRVIVPATVRIEPSALNSAANGVITAFIQLEAPYELEDVDLGSVQCQGAAAISGVVAGGQLIAKFRRDQLQSIASGPTAMLTVTGRLQDGSVFRAKDTVRLVR